MARNTEPSWVNSLLIYDCYPITYKFTISIFSATGFFAPNFSNFLFFWLNWANKGFHVFPLNMFAHVFLFLTHENIRFLTTGQHFHLWAKPNSLWGRKLLFQQSLSCHQPLSSIAFQPINIISQKNPPFFTPHFPLLPVSFSAKLVLHSVLRLLFQFALEPTPARILPHHSMH